jgi:hypothetical protein
MMKKFHGLLWFTIVLALLALGSVAVMVLWNWLVPALLGVGGVSFLQAAGLLALSRILLGGSGVARLFAGGLLGAGGRGRDNPLRDKWGKMSEDERWDFLRKYHERSNFFRGGFGGSDRRRGGETEDGKPATEDLSKTSADKKESTTSLKQRGM